MLTRRAVFGATAAIVVGVACAPLRAGRQWINTFKKPLRGHIEHDGQFAFSGEAFDQREPVLRAVDAWLRETADKVAGQNVWRIGQVRMRCRTGLAETADEIASCDPEGPQPIIQKAAPFGTVKNVHICPHCGECADEDGAPYAYGSWTHPRNPGRVVVRGGHERL